MYSHYELFRGILWIVEMTIGSLSASKLRVVLAGNVVTRKENYVEAKYVLRTYMGMYIVIVCTYHGFAFLYISSGLPQQTSWVS